MAMPCFNREVERKPVISEAVAYQMVSMLADVVDVGTGAAARSLGVRFPVARQDRHDQRIQGCMVRRLLVFDRRRRVGRLRSACADWPGRIRRAICAADLGRFHVAHRSPPQAGAVPRADDGRGRATLPRQPPAARAIPAPPTPEYFKHGDDVPEDKCDVHRGPGAAEVIGGIFSKIGKGIGKIFGRSVRLQPDPQVSV